MLRALQGPSTGNLAATTMIDAARAIGDDGGIDTLVIALGANNALPSAVQLRLAWTGMDANPVYLPDGLLDDRTNTRDSPRTTPGGTVSGYVSTRDRSRPPCFGDGYRAGARLRGG
jgi:hypothetical protein